MNELAYIVIQVVVIIGSLVLVFVARRRWEATRHPERPRRARSSGEGDPGHPQSPPGEARKPSPAATAPVSGRASSAPRSAHPSTALETEARPFRVVVDDNFHYMDEEERYEIGPFPTVEAAVGAARRIVDEFLRSAHRPGMTAEELFASYASFGEDPFILSDRAEHVSFSAWDYARTRCVEMCAHNSGDGKG